MHDSLLPVPSNGLFLREADDPTGNGEVAVELCGIKNGEVVHSGLHILTHGLNQSNLRAVVVPANVSSTGLFEADQAGLFSVSS